jgi:hypothetical protein
VEEQIGAVLVSKDGKILGQGHNQRVQKGSAVLHVRLTQQTSFAWKWNNDIALGRNGRSRRRGSTSRSGIQRRDNVHDSFAVRHVQRRVLFLRHKQGGIRREQYTVRGRVILEREGYRSHQYAEQGMRRFDEEIHPTAPRDLVS